MRLYLIPVDVQGNYRGPKYLRWRMNPTGLDVKWGAMDYGFVPSMLVCCPDITPADHATLTANADVLAFPENLDTAVSDAAFKAALETAYVPTNWTTPSTTYRQLLRSLAGMFAFAQRYSAISGRPLFGDGVTLDNNYNSLTAAQKSAFTETIRQMGHSGNIPGNPKLRTLAKQAGDLWGDAPFYLAGAEV